MKLTYKNTITASFASSVVQAIVNNFVPLLLLTLQKSYAIPLDKLTLLITVNFVVQLIIDFLSADFVDKIGYRTSIVIAHAAAALGMLGLAFLPEHLSDPYIGLLISIFLYAIGGGMIEVLMSPILEACPTKNKSGMMSLLHSFYCWGHVFVILFSTAFFVLFGIDHWRILSCIWAILPLLNGLYFLKVPLYPLVKEGKSLPVRELVSQKIFWLFILIMICAGASEQAMSQWASAFAESGLKVSKTIGDLAGPCFFALMMGISRAAYAKFSERADLLKFMSISTVLCIFSYLLAAFSSSPIWGLIGCGLCGLSVGVMWPGTYSLAASKMPRGGTAMFAYFALAGDLGCSSGPTLVGLISGLGGGNLKFGLAFAIIFPLLLIFSLILYKKAFCSQSSQ